MRRIAPWTALLLLVGAAAGLWLYGLGSGGGFYHRLVRAPLAPASEAPYYRESLLHVGLAHVLGLGRTLVGFRVFVLACFWAALAMITAVALRRLSLPHALLVWLVALSHPAAMIVHAWTCHPDAVMLLLATALMFARPAWSVAALGALMAWANLPMALVVGGSMMSLWHGFDEAGTRRRSAALVAGLVVGAASCRLTLWLAGVHLARDRFAAAAQQDPAVMLHRWTDVGWSGVYTLHFAHWLWLPVLVVVLLRRRPRAAAALVIGQLAALVAAVLAEDTTRVFACLAWPSLIYALFRALESLADDRLRLRPLVMLAVFLSLIGPKQFAWKGKLHDLESAHAHLRTLLR